MNKEVDVFAGGKEISVQQVTFGAVGDFIKATYTNKKLVHANGKDVWLYEVKGQVGTFHQVDGRKNPIEPAITVEDGSYYSIFGGKDQIDGLFAKAKIGDIVGIQLQKETPSKTKGNAAFKTYRTALFGAEPTYMGESSDMVDTTEATKEL